MGLCGDYRCGCGLTTDGSISISGSGEPGDPYVLGGGSTEWINYTPTLSQGASSNITFTALYSKYTRSGLTGKTITWHFHIGVQASGTAGSVVLLTVPTAGVIQYAISGSGYILDGSVPQRYVGTWEGASASTIQFVHDTSVGTAWGVQPNLAIANTDFLSGLLVYEALA